MQDGWQGDDDAACAVWQLFGRRRAVCATARHVPLLNCAAVELCCASSHWLYAAGLRRVPRARAPRWPQEARVQGTHAGSVLSLHLFSALTLTSEPAHAWATPSASLLLHLWRRSRQSPYSMHAPRFPPAGHCVRQARAPGCDAAEAHPQPAERGRGASGPQVRRPARAEQLLGEPGGQRAWGEAGGAWGSWQHSCQLVTPASGAAWRPWPGCRAEPAEPLRERSTFS